MLGHFLFSLLINMPDNIQGPVLYLVKNFLKIKADNSQGGNDQPGGK